VRSIPKSARVLGLAGLIPFLASAASQWVAVPYITPAFGLTAGMFYGAVILSFLGGIRWGTTMISPTVELEGKHLAGSVVAPLVGWISLLLAPVVGLCLLIAGFLLQAFWDVLSVEKNQLPQWFGKLRMILTAGAVLALSSMLVHLSVS
jgi:Protein of unknown function (DUF3429)